MTQEYIETVVLDDPLGEAQKSLIGEPPTQTTPPPVAEQAAPGDDDPAEPGGYSWLS